MDNRIWIMIMLILLIPFATAQIDIEEYEQTQQQQTTQLSALNTNLSNINAKLDNAATKQELVELLNQFSEMIDRKMNEFILNMIIGNMAIAGVIFGFYFYFKMKRRT